MTNRLRTDYADFIAEYPDAWMAAVQRINTSVTAGRLKSRQDWFEEERARIGAGGPAELVSLRQGQRERNRKDVQEAFQSALYESDPRKQSELLKEIGRTARAITDYDKYRTDTSRRC